MDLKQLRYFVRVAELASFTRAAADMRIAQSALSYHISTLEAELGVGLLDRHSRGVTLTEAGRSVLAHAHRVLQGANDLKADAFSHTRFPSGHIVFAAPPSIARALAPSVIERFRAEYPQVRLTMREETVDVIHSWLLTEEIDLGMAFDPPNLSTVEPELLLVDHLHLVGANRTALPDDLSIPELASLPLVLTTTSYGWRRRLERALQEHDLKPTIRAEVDSLSVIKELMVRGFGYTVLPQSAISQELQSGALWALPITGLKLDTSLMMVRLKRRALTLAAEALCVMIRAEALRLTEKASGSTPS
ncbi:LysR family transcriptional regulator [Mesorhizobium sp. 1B3]|uniref:LysR family transcriptional regulator n=1 Tax=Mesorhizobium sp. 1B3 TaxID=3243599 RepID=UPI003D997FF7